MSLRKEEYVSDPLPCAVNDLALCEKFGLYVEDEPRDEGGVLGLEDAEGRKLFFIDLHGHRLFKAQRHLIN